MPFPAIPVISGLFNLGSQWLGNKGKKAEAIHETEMAVQQRKTDLAKGEQSHNHTWELAALTGEDSGAKWARWFFIVFYTIPVVYTCFDPVEGTKIWKALEEVPNWIIGVVVTMTGWAFAAKSLQSVGAGMVGSVINFPKLTRHEPKDALADGLDKTNE